MKLKILPPTLREKKRYIAINLYSQEALEKDKIIQILWNSILNIHGELTASKINLWFVNLKEVPNEDRYQYKCMVKFSRGYDKQVRLAFNTITNYNKNRIVVETIGISGTLKSLDKKYDMR
ncbi:MAG: hypothetical protein E7Z86_00635 [Methanosphaera stadtmanae]|jgi:ribonuclease P/MRP protein subunit POP5|nr:hypothetical protein [Methanosphaera stadtmanae]